MNTLFSLEIRKPEFHTQIRGTTNGDNKNITQNFGLHGRCV